MMTVSIQEYFKPNGFDIKYTAQDQLIISLILRTDSYKLTHPFMFDQLQRRKNVVGMTAYGEARISQDEKITMFGMQMLLMKFFSKPITMEHVDAAEQFALAHFGRPLFHRESWEKVVRVYGGFPPLIIRAVPDGTVVRGRDPLYTVTCLDPDVKWMASGFETIILRGVWYPTTVASLDRDTKVELKRLYEISGADLAGLGFALHDFGGRGVTCGEQAEVGGAAHTLNFMGSDTIEGVLAANFYYDEPMVAFSVFATEHSVECSFGLDEEGEGEYIKSVLANALPGTIVSIVVDGKDTKRCVRRLCAPRAEGGFREDIIETQAKVVFRPDSGDMFEIVPWIIKLQEEAFGVDVNAKGFKKIKHVGVIQGDGVDRLNMLTLVGNLVAMGYSADVVVFGSGGALLQKVDRDTKKFAQKGSAILVQAKDGTQTWVGTAKDPITDPGKKSKEGVLTLIKNTSTGELRTCYLDRESIPEGWEDMHRLMYYYGELYNKTSLKVARERSAV
jgi:nicotinamide phosphoribosyltransferase